MSNAKTISEILKNLSEDELRALKEQLVGESGAVGAPQPEDPIASAVRPIADAFALPSLSKRIEVYQALGLNVDQAESARAGDRSAVLQIIANVGKIELPAVDPKIEAEYRKAKENFDRELQRVKALEDNLIARAKLPSLKSGTSGKRRSGSWTVPKRWSVQKRGHTFLVEKSDSGFLCTIDGKQTITAHSLTGLYDQLYSEEGGILGRASKFSGPRFFLENATVIEK